jgi:hypothetical protein
MVSYTNEMTFKTKLLINSEGNNRFIPAPASMCLWSLVILMTQKSHPYF